MPLDFISNITDAELARLAGDAAFEFANGRDAAAKPAARPLPPWHSSLQPDRIPGSIAVLARARQLIAEEERWCRRTFARGWRGIPVPVQSGAARRFCAIGALLRAAREIGWPIEDAQNALEWQTMRPVQDWNDDPARSHREVVAAFDAAIAALDGGSASGSSFGAVLSRR